MVSAWLARSAPNSMETEEPSAPELLSSAINVLWRASHVTEKKAFHSKAFKDLEKSCRNIYSSINGSRIPQEPSTTSWLIGLQSALHNFLRWNGAPWYGGEFPNSDKTALRLHRAFLSSQVSRTYLVPLDRLCLVNKSARPRTNVKNIHYGPNEIVLLTKSELSRRIPEDGLRRFGHQYEFPTERLGDRYWLIVNVQEKAGAIWKRMWRRFLYEPIGAFGTTPMFKPIFPNEIEEAIFVLLLSLQKGPNDITWNSFTVPWVYSFTDDPFAKPSPSPNPSELSWDIIGDPGEEFEVANKSEEFDLTDESAQGVRQRWDKLQTVLANTNDENSSFHPLTLHFFVKAFTEEGIDEIIANISYFEATLRLPDEFSKEKSIKRYERLVKDEDCHQWLRNAYILRNRYLHSLADPKATITSMDIARTRLSVVIAVDAYLNLASRHNDRNRESLLNTLSHEQTVGN